MPPASADPDLRGSIESAPDAIVVADPGTREIVDANRAAADFFGYDREALRSMDVFDIHPPEERERYGRLFAEHIENQPAVISRFDDGSPVFVVTAEGRRVPVEINAWLTDDGGEPLFHGVFRDVAERLRRERELQRQYERLEEFASVVSHDLRNPLNVAQGRATLVREECESEHVEPVLAALDRMESIIEDTLTLARNGERVGEMEPIAATDLLRDCWGMVDTEEAKLAVDDRFSIRGDREGVCHVFENLFRNAVEHGGDDVTVRVGLNDGTTMYVEDDGPGIPDDERDAAFDAGHSSTPGGTGFGLATVERISEAHGWEVKLTEGNAGGARFEFSGIESER